MTETFLKSFDTVSSNRLYGEEILRGRISCLRTGSLIGEIFMQSVLEDTFRELNSQVCQNTMYKVQPTFKRKVANETPKNAPKMAKPNLASVKQDPATSSIGNNFVTTTKASTDALVNVNQNLTTGEKSFQCSLCGYSSTDSKRNVVRHIDSKHLGTSFTCKTCGASASQKYGLKKHYVTKHGLSEDAARVMVD